MPISEKYIQRLHRDQALCRDMIQKGFESYRLPLDILTETLKYIEKEEKELAEKLQSFEEEWKESYRDLREEWNMKSLPNPPYPPKVVKLRDKFDHHP
jgi:hypothetical protein